MSVLRKLLPAVLVTMLISCDPPISSNSQETKNSGEQADTTHTLRPITFYKVSGRVLLIGEKIKLLDSTFQEVQDISRFHEHWVEVTEVSDDYYLPPSDGEPCDRFKYVKIKTEEFEGYVDGRKIYGIGKDIKNKFVNIDGKKISLITSHNFRIGTTDEDGLTFCEVRTPALFSEDETGYGHLVKMVKNEHYTDNYPYLELKSDDQADDEVLSIEKEQDKYLVKIKREFQEGDTTLQLYIFKDANGSYLAEIIKN